MIDKELEQNILNWGKAKGIFEHSTFEKQMEKCHEETRELGVEILNDNAFGVINEAGDCLVTLTLASFMAKNFPLSVFGINPSYAHRFPLGHWYLILVAKTAAYERDQLDKDLLRAFDALTAIAAIYSSTPNECLQAAYDKISKRSGRMVGGLFVKDAEAK